MGVQFSKETNQDLILIFSSQGRGSEESRDQQSLASLKGPVNREQNPWSVCGVQLCIDIVQLSISNPFPFLLDPREEALPNFKLVVKGLDGRPVKGSAQY